MAKRKIKKRIEEDKRDIKYRKNTIVIAQLKNYENIAIDFIDVKKMTNYVNNNYAFDREVIIISLKLAGIPKSQSVQNMNETLSQVRHYCPKLKFMHCHFFFFKCFHVLDCV